VQKYIKNHYAILAAAREPLLIAVVAGVILIQTLVLKASLGPTTDP